MNLTEMSSSRLLLSVTTMPFLGGSVGSASGPVRDHSRSSAVGDRGGSFGTDCPTSDQWQAKDSAIARSSSRKTSSLRSKVGGNDGSNLLQPTGAEHLFPAGSPREGLSPPRPPTRNRAIGNLPISKSQVDTTGKMDGQGTLQNSYVSASQDGAVGRPVRAAFFDVDGTITRTNVVFAYFAVRRSELTFVKRLLWIPWFLLSCVVYLVVDRFHRPTFNKIFYLSYRGRLAEGQKAAMANLVFQQYYRPRIMIEAAEQIQKLKERGYHIVFVTGALDFQVAPLARELGADFVFAAKLIEENGRFTGELHNMRSSVSEKADCVWAYAKRFGISLEESMAFGDSIADVAMLEAVGCPYAVNPDARLRAIALKRRWTVLEWSALKPTIVASV